jgi:hypothetical protein
VPPPATLSINCVTEPQPRAGFPASTGTTLSNQYDGHTLAEQIEQTTILMHDTGAKPRTAWVDPGYRGVEADNRETEIKHRGKKTRRTVLELRTLKRRQAIEPVIGHLKSDHRMGRCHLFELRLTLPRLGHRGKRASYPITA